MINTIHIPYKELRKLSPETARKAVLEYLKSNKGNKSQTAKAFGINRSVVYDILHKEKEGSLKDRSKVPISQPRKTPKAIEDLVIEIKNKTNYGPERIHDYALEHHNVKVCPGTIRHILRRNKDLVKQKFRYIRRKQTRPVVDWYSAKPFEVVQIDLKYIRDQKALSKDQIIHLDKHNIPNYQWSAIDVNSRFKLISYSQEKSFTNGLCFFLWVTSYLRANNVTCEIVYTVDNGEEFGGKSWFKITDLRKLLSGFGCKLIQNHKGHPEENAHLERSHKTDDEEFYCLRSHLIKSKRDLCEEGLKYIYYYNNLRKHSSLGRKTPFQHLKEQMPQINDNIRLVRPFILDEVAVKLGPWSGYHVLAHYLQETCSLDIKSAKISSGNGSALICMVFPCLSK